MKLITERNTFHYMKKLKLGKWGEDQAVQFLNRRGYAVIATNYYSRHGEIDIIAQKVYNKNELYIIEVKTRKAHNGSAEKATDEYKQHKIYKTAQEYCIKKKINIDKTTFYFKQISVYVLKDKVRLVMYSINN